MDQFYKLKGIINLINGFVGVLYSFDDGLKNLFMIGGLQNIYGVVVSGVIMGIDLVVQYLVGYGGNWV